jgi:phosphoenolpyruvate carboxykinase (ATP)
MNIVSKTPKYKDLSKYGLKGVNANWNLDGETLQRITVVQGMGKETENGTLCVSTGKFTGRSPSDRFLVKDDITSDKVWWGRVNKPISPGHFDHLYDEVITYLCGKEIYIRDAFVCAHPDYRMNVRTITEYPWSSFFIKNMFLRLNEYEAGEFEEEWLVICAPGFQAKDPALFGVLHGNFSILNFTKKIALVAGSAYTGEMKKGIFSALNLILPMEKDVLPCIVLPTWVRRAIPLSSSVFREPGKLRFLPTPGEN